MQRSGRFNYSPFLLFLFDWILLVMTVVENLNKEFVRAKRMVLVDMLGQCTEEERERFYSISGDKDPPSDRLDRSIDLVERTLRKAGKVSPWMSS